MIRTIQIEVAEKKTGQNTTPNQAKNLLSCSPIRIIYHPINSFRRFKESSHQQQQHQQKHRRPKVKEVKIQTFHKEKRTGTNTHFCSPLLFVCYSRVRHAENVCLCCNEPTQQKQQWQQHIHFCDLVEQKKDKHKTNRRRRMRRRRGGKPNETLVKKTLVREERKHGKYTQGK